MRLRAAGVALALTAICITPNDLAAQTIDGPTFEWKHSNWGKRRANTEFMEKLNETLKNITVTDIKARTGNKLADYRGLGLQFLGGRQIDIAGQHQHRIGGAVVGLEPGLDVLERGGLEVVHAADHAALGL